MKGLSVVEMMLMKEFLKDNNLFQKTEKHSDVLRDFRRVKKLLAELDKEKKEEESKKKEPPKKKATEVNPVMLFLAGLMFGPVIGFGYLHLMSALATSLK